MAILERVRNVLTRRRSEPELTTETAAPLAQVQGTQADALFRALQESEDARRQNETDSDHSPYMPPPSRSPRAEGRAMISIEPKPTRKSSRESADTTGDMPSLISRIDQHMEGQSDRADQLLTLMEHLPSALEAVPEMNRHSQRLLEAVTEGQQYMRQRDAALNTTLDRIGNANERHTEVLGLLQQQLDANEQATTRISETLGDFRQVLRDMAESTSQSVDVLSRMARASEKRELRITTTLAKTQKWMIAAMIFCGAVTLAAIGVAVLVLIG